MFRALWLMPKDHPAWSSIVTGVAAITLLGNGVADAFKLSQDIIPHGTILEPLLYIPGGVLLLALTIFAAYRTNWFRNWGPSERLGHPIVRWIGPLALIVVLSEILLILLFLGVAFGSNKKEKE